MYKKSDKMWTVSELSPPYDSFLAVIYFIHNKEQILAIRYVTYIYVMWAI